MRPDAERPIDPTETMCPVCGVDLDEDEQGLPICRACDEAFEADLVRWVTYTLACRSGQRLVAG